MFGNKRLLFAKNLPINKVGTVGCFWHEPIEEMRKRKRKVEEGIALGFAQHGVGDLVEHVYQFLEGTVSKNEIKRNFGLHWNSLSVQQWIKSLNF